MKTFKTTLLTTTMLLCSTSLFAVVDYDFKVGGICYNITSETNKTVSVTYNDFYVGEIDHTVNPPNYYTKYTGSVIIPEYVMYNAITYRVERIGNNAFYNCSGLTSIVIPNSVTSIGYNAFYNCSGLTSVTIPNSVRSIGDYAFSGCSGLTSVTIGYRVTSIGDYAFDGCENLSIVINRSNLSIRAGGSSYGHVAYYANKVIKQTYIEHIGDFLFGKEGEKYCIIGYDGDNPAITLPSSYNGSDYSIGTYAFNYCSSLTSVTIPNSVTSIGSNAFEGCSGLTSVTIPNSVTSIGRFAFGDTPWYNAKPDGLVYINNVLYKYKGTMPSGTAIEIKEGTISISSSAFSYCSGLSSVTIPNSVTSIGDDAFYGCSLKSLTIGTGVLSIGSDQCKPVKTIWLTNTPPSGYGNLQGNINYVANDQYSGLSNVRVYPYLSSAFETDGVKYVPVSPAERTCDAIDCSYDSTVVDINIGETVSFKGVEMKVQNLKPYTVYKQTSVKTLSVSHSGDIGNYAFYGCTGITDATISNEGNIGESAFQGAMTSGNAVLKVSNKGIIGRYAFYGCTGIADATISNEGYIGLSAFEGAITSGNAVLKVSNKGDIYQKAFYGCTGITDATISNDGNIGESAFEGAMTSGNAVLKVSNKGIIDAKAFYSCTGIADATISNEGNIGESAFEGAMTSGKAALRASNKGIIGAKAFYGCTGIADATISNKGAIGDAAFNGCTSLQTATLGDKVTSLGAYAFSGCSSLQGFVIPNSVESIGAYAFSGCSAMKSVKMGSGVTKIDNYTFQDCSALTDMNIGSNVETIGTYVFSGCSALQEIVIPQATTSIGNYAFSGCHGLADVIIKDRTETLSLGNNGSSSLFASCPLDSVYIGGKITYGTSSSNGYSPFYRNTALRTVVITDKETEIYANEFYGCTNLKNVSIGSNVKKIGNRAFSGCSNLDYFSFGKSVESIGEEAFSDCVNLTQLISHAVTPPTCGTQALDDINKWNCTLKIPEGTNSAYMAADQWKEFFFIENVPNAINGVVVDGDDTGKNAPVYNLQGMKMQNADNLPKGIYIKGGKKYIIK